MYPDDVSEKNMRRNEHARRLDRAIQKTKKLLDSPAADADASLRQRWEAKLTRQQENLRGVCSV